jgi:hypothetical protein
MGGPGSGWHSASSNTGTMTGSTETRDVISLLRGSTEAGSEVITVVLLVRGKCCCRCRSFCKEKGIHRHFSKEGSSWSLLCQSSTSFSPIVLAMVQAAHDGCYYSGCVQIGIR